MQQVHVKIGSPIRATAEGIEDGQVVHRPGDVGRVVDARGAQLLVRFPGVALAQTMTLGEDAEIV